LTNTRWLRQTIEREEVRLDSEGKERRMVLVKAFSYNEWRACQLLLKYADRVELVSPPSMREAMHQSILKMCHLYEKKAEKA